MLSDPRAMGPAAPAGTSAPCESHVETITVVKMIGNTLAMPLAIGSPD